MSASADLLTLPATELRRRVLARELGAEELVRLTLERIEDQNPRLNAVVTLDESALDQARAVDRRVAAGERPVLAGLPTGIKDVTPVAGVRTTWGSPLYADHVPEVDALVVQRLRAAGAVIVGKTNTPEFATGGNTFNPVFGRTRNPWNPELSAGGSTGGGGSALASGMIALAEGTDLGGSLRIPASFCGVVGLRPTPGLVPTWPTDFLWDDLQVTGIMARTASDVGLALSAVAGRDPAVPVSRDPVGDLDAIGPATLEGRRLAFCPDVAGIGIDATVERVCREAIETLRETGAEVEEIALDLSAGREAFLALRGWWMVIQQYRRLDRLEELGDNLRGNVEAGLRTTTRDLAAAEHTRAALYAQVLELLGRFDALITPSMAVSPFPVEENYPRTVGGREMATYVDWIAPTFVLSLTALPVASVPCGRDRGGMPVGLQLVGRPRGEAAVLALAAAVQEVRPMGRAPLRRGSETAD